MSKKSIARTKASTKQVPVKKETRLGFYLTIAVLFIAAGSLLAWQPVMNRIRIKKVIASAPTAAPARTEEVKVAAKTNTPISGKPTRLVIPTLNIDIAIIDGVYDAVSKTWTLSNDKAQYAMMTPQPNNQAGNTFIYGHAKPAVFAKLPKLELGAKVMLYSENGHVFTYIYRSAYETSPNDSSLFDYQGAPILTLQTCSGLWSQNRFLMTFDLVGVS